MVGSNPHSTDEGTEAQVTCFVNGRTKVRTQIQLLTFLDHGFHWQPGETNGPISKKCFKKYKIKHKITDTFEIDNKCQSYKNTDAKPIFSQLWHAMCYTCVSLLTS